MCVSVGYPKGTKGGLFNCPKENKELSKGMETQSSEKQNDQVPDKDVVQPQHHDGVVATDVVRSHSGRETRQSVCYTLLGESYDRIPEEPTTEPVDCDKALLDKNADKWGVATKSDMDFMYSNQVWDLVEPPDGVKFIRCKWLYKKKRGVDRKVQAFKERVYLE
ncbi:uncharacterized protein [Nicotiana sylvestris]|uniref:uncharacterized protein n=1 Tax=Nicotiana sylvestris TaxID=4096 RepID=UPI00388C6D70